MAAQHKASAAKFGRLRREIEVALVAPIPQDSQALFTHLQHQFDDLIEQSPAIPQSIHDKARALVGASEARAAGSARAAACVLTRGRA